MAYYTLTPGQVDWRGGTLIRLEYPWAAPVPLYAQYQQGDNTLPCYSAEAGQGNALTPLGQVLRFVSPALPAGTTGPGTVTITDANGNTVLQVPVPCLPPMYLTTTYALRNLLPSTWAVGARSLADEPLT